MNKKYSYAELLVLLILTWFCLGIEFYIGFGIRSDVPSESPPKRQDTRRKIARWDECDQLSLMNRLKEKEDSIFSQPAAHEFEHVTFDACVIREPKTDKGMTSIIIQTNFGHIVSVVLSGRDGRTNRIQYGDYIRVNGEISGATLYKDREIPIIDDSRITMNLEYEHTDPSDDPPDKASGHKRSQKKP